MCGTLAKGLSKMKTHKRLRAQGSVEAREVPTHNRIAEESAARPSLPVAKMLKICRNVSEGRLREVWEGMND